MGPTTRAKRKSMQAQEEPADGPTRLNDVAEHAADSSLLVKPESEGKEPTAAVPQGKVVFFDDNDAQGTTSEVAPKELPKEASAPKAKRDVVEEQEGDEDSDDEAPEAVSTSHAALEMKKAAQASQKAAKEQAAAQKRKRQQRDEMLKQQAERKKAELASKTAETQGKKEEEEDDDEDEDEEKQEEKAEARKDPKSYERGGTQGRRRADKLQIPTLLPAELLTDSSDEDEADENPGGGANGSIRRKRRKVSAVENRLTRLDNKGPSDEKVGSTVYRVMKKVDGKMAPKSSKVSKNFKDALLRRNRTAVKAKTGFFKRKG